MTSAFNSITSSLPSLPSLGRAKLLLNHADDVVICAAVRTAVTKARKGGFKDTAPEELLENVLREVVKRSGVDAKLIE